MRNANAPDLQQFLRQLLGIGQDALNDRNGGAKLPIGGRRGRSSSLLEIGRKHLMVVPRSTAVADCRPYLSSRSGLSDPQATVARLIEERCRNDGHIDFPANEPALGGIIS